MLIPLFSVEALLASPSQRGGMAELDWRDGAVTTARIAGRDGALAGEENVVVTSGFERWRDAISRI